MKDVDLCAPRLPLPKRALPDDVRAKIKRAPKAAVPAAAKYGASTPTSAKASKPAATKRMSPRTAATAVAATKKGGGK